MQTQETKIQSHTAEEHFRRGLEAAQLGFPDKAAAEFEQAAILDPRNPQLQFNLGTAYLTMGEFEQAIINLSKAVSLDPAMSDGWGNLAVAHTAIGEDERAERAAAEAMKLGAFPDGLKAVIDHVRNLRTPAAKMPSRRLGNP